MQTVTVDKSIRRLTRRNWTTRQIARVLPVSQTTVVRRQHAMGIGTGPQPVLPADALAPPARPRRSSPAQTAAAIILGALIAIAGAALLTWTRTPPPDPQMTVCVKYDPAGAVTGLAAAGDSCPPGWAVLTLTSGRG